jgi:hypothetical protein
MDMVFLLSSVASTLRTMWQIVQLSLFMSAGLTGNEAKSVPPRYRKKRRFFGMTMHAQQVLTICEA